MPNELPFSLTPESVTLLKRQLRRGPRGLEPALITVMSFEEHTPEGKLTASYYGEHFAIAWYPPGQRQNASDLDLLGQRVSIIPETLDRLRGKTFVVSHVVVGQSWFRRRRRKLLVVV